MARRKALYREGTWKGHRMFFCAVCRSTATTEAEIVAHLRTMHPTPKATPLTLPDTFRTGKDKIQVLPPPVPAVTTTPSLSMSKLDLLALALEIGAQFPQKATKAEIVAAIKAAQKEH